MAARKADLVKIWLDDAGKALPAKVTPEVYSAVIDEGHKNGLRPRTSMISTMPRRSSARGSISSLTASATSQWTPSSSRW
jgi:hypothetical protein